MQLLATTEMRMSITAVSHDTCTIPNRSHFPSLIQPYMVRKCSFRGFQNSFGRFPCRSRGSYLAFPGPGSKMLNLKFSIFILWHFLAFSLARKCPLWDPQNSFWEFLGSLIRNIEYWSQMYVFRVFPPGCGFLACQTRFSKHVDNGPFHWSCSLAVFTVSVAFVCFLFLTMNLSWVIFAVFNDLAWKCCLCMRFSIQAHCQHRGLGSSVFWHFAFSQTCSMVIPCWQSSPCTCTFCSLEQGSQKVHRCVRASSSPRSAGASELRFDMLCFCMLCFMVSPCI